MTKKCQNCGKAFEAARNDAKYCSDTCKTKHYQQRQKKKAEAEKEKARQDQRDQNIKSQVGKVEQENISIQSQITWSENEISRLENNNGVFAYQIEIAQNSKSQTDKVVDADDKYIYETFLKKKEHGYVSQHYSKYSKSYASFRTEIDAVKSQKRIEQNNHILKIKELKGKININEKAISLEKEKIQSRKNQIQINMSRLMSLDKYR